MQNSYTKGLFAEFFPSVIMVLMPVNQVDTAFEYAVICLLDNFRVSQQHREGSGYMIMLLNIVTDDLHHISTDTYFI